MELGEQYNTLQSYGQAEEYFLLALDALKENSDLNRTPLPKILYNLGLTQFYMGAYEESLESYHKAQDLLTDKPSPDPALQGSILFSEAAVYINQKKYDSGISALEKAYEHEKETLEETHPNITRDLFKLADAYRLQGLYEKAKVAFEHYIEMFRRTCGEEQPEMVTGLHHLALISVELRKF